MDRSFGPPLGFSPGSDLAGPSGLSPHRAYNFTICGQENAAAQFPVSPTRLLRQGFVGQAHTPMPRRPCSRVEIPQPSIPAFAFCLFSFLLFPTHAAAELIHSMAMKGKVLVITSSNNQTAYLPVSRLLRIETVPASVATGVSVITLVFERFQVTLETGPGAETKVAQDLYERLVPADDRDLTYLRPDSENGVNDIQFAPF
jgi:hypothetical protein